MSHFESTPTPLEITESLLQHLPPTDLSSFRLACNQADKQTFESIARKYFSVWKTSLMDSDLQTLHDLSLHEELRIYVKSIHIQDDWEEYDPGPMIAGPNASQPEGAVNIWPRNKERIIQSASIGVAQLRDILKSQKLRPDTITIRDFHGGNVACDPEPCAALARDIFQDSDMAITSFAFRRDSESFGALEMSFSLSAENQGRGIGFSMLRSAQFILTRNLGSYWPERVCHAPNPLNFTVGQAKPRPDANSPLLVGVQPPKLASLMIARAELSKQTVLDFIANSKTSLKSLSFHTVTLKLHDGCSWDSLLSQIAKDWTALERFDLRLLSVDVWKAPFVKFQLSKETISAHSLASLELTERGPEGGRRVTGVRYDGPDVVNVLTAVAGSTVQWGHGM